MEVQKRLFRTDGLDVLPEPLHVVTVMKGGYVLTAADWRRLRERVALFLSANEVEGFVRRLVQGWRAVDVRPIRGDDAMDLIESRLVKHAVDTANHRHRQESMIEHAKERSGMRRSRRG